LHDSGHRESHISARSRFRSGLLRLSGETFGQAHSRSAADEGISPAVVISIRARCDCRIVRTPGSLFAKKRSAYIGYVHAVGKPPRAAAMSATWLARGCVVMAGSWSKVGPDSALTGAT